MLSTFNTLYILGIIKIFYYNIEQKYGVEIAVINV